MNTTTQLAAEVMRDGASSARIAHAALFERIVTRIHRYFRRMVKNDHEGDECLQRTLMLLEQSLVEGKYDAGRSFNTWMWLKARTVYAQWCREREKAPQPLGDGEAQVTAPAPRDHVSSTDEALDATLVLEQVRAHLGGEAYEAFVLYYEGGLTQAEVASALDRDRKTIRKRLAEAHDLIDKLLGRKD